MAIDKLSHFAPRESSRGLDGRKIFPLVTSMLLLFMSIPYFILHESKKSSSATHKNLFLNQIATPQTEMVEVAERFFEQSIKNKTEIPNKKSGSCGTCPSFNGKEAPSASSKTLSTGKRVDRWFIITGRTRNQTTVMNPTEIHTFSIKGMGQRGRLIVLSGDTNSEVYRDHLWWEISNEHVIFRRLEQGNEVIIPYQIKNTALHINLTWIAENLLALSKEPLLETYSSGKKALNYFVTSADSQRVLLSSIQSNSTTHIDEMMIGVDRNGHVQTIELTQGELNDLEFRARRSLIWVTFSSASLGEDVRPREKKSAD